MESGISFAIASLIVICLGYFVVYYRNCCVNKSILVEAFKEIVKARFYEDFKHASSLEDKRKILMKVEVLRDNEILNIFDHPNEFLAALEYYVKLMKHDIELDIAMVKANDLLKNMDM